MADSIHGQRISVTAAALASEPRAAVTAARAAGFAGIAFDAFSPAIDLTQLSQTGRREFRHLLASSQLTLVNIRADLAPPGFGPGADIDRLLSKLDAVFESAVGLGAISTCIDLGPLPAPAVVPRIRPAITPELAGLILLPTSVATEPDVLPTVPADPAFVSELDTAMAELGVRADRYNAPVAFSSSLAGFAAVERALVAARCPWFGVDLDPIALLRDTWPGDEIFSRLGSLIRHVRGRDAVIGAEGRTKPAVIARGDAKWSDLLGRLDHAGYGGWITVDPMELTDRRAGAVAGLKQLNAFLE